jgi:hypothetical protein
MGNIILGLCILALFLFALRKAIRHLRGKEDCGCGCGTACCHCNNLKTSEPQDTTKGESK